MKILLLKQSSNPFSKKLVKSRMKSVLSEKLLKLQTSAAESKEIARQLQVENHHLRNELDACSSKVKITEEKVEDRTNRQLRKTLIFKGISEDPDDEQLHNNSNNSHKKDTETWNDTERKLAKAIAEITGSEVANCKRWIERCHRAAPRKTKDGRQRPGPRPIFAAFYDWKDSEYVKDEFLKNNISHKASRIYAEQKYGPLTSNRRNQALVIRKQLKAAGTIQSGYVTYAAKLMVKGPGEGTKYYLYKDFSKEEVNFEN